jgi:hypothetical protein
VLAFTDYTIASASERHRFRLLESEMNVYTKEKNLTSDFILAFRFLFGMVRIGTIPIGIGTV